MTASEFTKALASLGWRQADLSRRAEVSKNTVSRWAQGGPPKWASEYLGALLALDAIHRQFVRPQKPESTTKEDAAPVSLRAAERVSRFKKNAA